MLKASSLKKNEQQLSALSRELKNILARIDDELKVAHEQGKHSVNVSVPITFSIPHMKNSDAQRHIYYNILLSLLNRGFHPTFETTKDATCFHVTWLSKEEQNDIELQSITLAKYTKQR